MGTNAETAAFNLRTARKAARTLCISAKCTKRNAENVKVYVERLFVAQTTGNAMDGETARWVASLDSTMAEKLAKVGLIEGRAIGDAEILLDSYVAERSDVKPSTAVVYGHTRRCLIANFGANKPLRAITEGDADSFRLYLISEGLSENTVRRRCGIAKQFFSAAKRKRLITENPFDGLKAATIANRKRDYFITTKEADAILSACPDAQWRLIFALSRFGGLALPIRASRHQVGRRGLGAWAIDGPQSQNGAPRRGRIANPSAIPCVTWPPGSGLRCGRAGKPNS